jgi:hypothetical protein
MATDGHGGDFVPTGPTHNLGYEPDHFAVKTILVVPGAVLATILVVYVITTLIFGNIFGPNAEEVKPTVPAGAERNAAPLNERIARISSTDPKADYLQPRLEGVQQKRNYYKDGNPENKDPSNVVTPEMIPTQPTVKGNSPLYHSDDLRPENVPAVAHPTTPGAVAVDKAIELASDPKNAAWAKALPSAPGAGKLTEEWNRPKEANGGNTHWPAPAQPKKEPAKKEPEAKKEEPKKDEPKKQ